MGDSLTINGSRVMLPSAKSKPAELVSKIAERLPGLIPPEVNKEQFLCALLAEMNMLPEDCTPASVAKYAMNSAILGLVSGQALGHCHAVPFRKGNAREVTLVVGYRGYIELGLSSGHVAGVTPELIFKGEKYRRWNSIEGPQFRHELDFDIRDKATVGANPLDQVVASYCLWHTHDGHHDVTMVAGAQLRSLAKKQGNVWNEHPLEMALKTPIRRASKTWKLTGRLAHAVRLDEQAERGESQDTLALETGRREPTLSLSDLAGGQPAQQPAIASNRISQVTGADSDVATILRPLLDDSAAWDRAIKQLTTGKSESDRDEVYFIADQLRNGNL